MTPGTKLISCVAPNGKRKEFTINPTGKTHIALLHEFVQLSMGEAPQIQFTERCKHIFYNMYQKLVNKYEI